MTSWSTSLGVILDDENIDELDGAEGSEEGTDDQVDEAEAEVAAGDGSEES